MTSHFPIPARNFSEEEDEPKNEEDWTEKLERQMRIDKNSHTLGSSQKDEHPATNEHWTKKLERLMRTDNTENSHKLGERNSLVFLHTHPGQENARDYTDEEMIALKKRDFETRIFITGDRCGENSGESIRLIESACW